VKEGPTYESQYELNTNTGNTENTENSEITQIAAKLGEGVFQKYVIPRVDIKLEASKVTGITYSHSTNIMYVHGEKVEAISIQKALLDFLEFVLNACNLLKEL
jgi:lipoate-protein ligase A